MFNYYPNHFLSTPLVWPDHSFLLWYRRFKKITWTTYYYQFVDCSSCSGPYKNENVFILWCIECFFQDLPWLLSHHICSQWWNIGGGVCVPVKGQHLSCDKSLDEVQRLSGCNVVAVDNLPGSIRSFKDRVTSNNITINVIGKLEQIKLMKF